MLSLELNNGRIVTFYSYKGGTGRTMLLSNAAWILASAGKKVLIIDWDLEAPGLHQYFHPFLIDPKIEETQGLIDMIVNYAGLAVTPPDADDDAGNDDLDWARDAADIGPYIASVNWQHFSRGGQIHLLPAGRQDASYSTKVNTFDWRHFYQELSGGAFFELIRERIKNKYDYILIDSRTGVSDTSGICTVQMPDDLVVCFTPSEQNVRGSVAVATYVASQWKTYKDANKRRILPVLTRVEVSEKDKLDTTREYVRGLFRPFILIVGINEENYWKGAEISYWPYYAFEEILAVFGDPIRAPISLLSSCELFVSTLTRGEVIEAELPEAILREKAVSTYSRRKVHVPTAAAVAPRVWLSYSRMDGEEFASELRRWLEKENLAVWQDLIALEGGADWWSHIEDALKSTALQHLVLVVTPGSLESPTVRLQIRLARQEGKTVCPVKGPGLHDLGKLPRWLGHIYDLEVPEYRRTLIRVLGSKSFQKRVPMMAPELPQDFVQRPREFDALKSSLLNPRGDAIAAIDAGGYGKTMLARALAQDPDIQDAYFDGILWAEVGGKADRLLATLSDLIRLLTGEQLALETLNAAATKLGEALGERRILIVVDDVWRAQDLGPFLEGGPNCVRLVTTRIDSVLPQTALRQPVDAMRANEALSLLSAGLPADDVARGHANLAGLTARLGEWALLLKIVNGFLRDRVVSANQPLSVAIAAANKRLDAKGLVAFDARGASDRTKAVGLAIGVSLELLSESEGTRFCELGVFPDGVDIPIGVVARLWKATGDLEDFETEDLLRRLYDLSLLLDLDFGQRFFRLHDTIRHFLRDRAGAGELAAWHRQLVASLDPAASADADAPTRRYYYLYLPYHLAEAGERERLDALLLDPDWLKAKLEATANPQALVADYQRYGVGEVQGLIGRTLRLISGIRARDPRQLPQQLIGRLEGFKVIAKSGFIDRAARLLPRSSIVPLRPTLTSPGAEIARLEGHAGPIYALCWLEDGRLASGSWDGAIRLWDLAAGAEAGRLAGHAGPVNAVCRLEDGRLASGSADGTIRLWDVATGAETGRLSGHAGYVLAFCLLEGGRLASGSADGTIRLWDVATGAETGRLLGRAGWVGPLCRLEDGRLASGSADGTIRLWDAAVGAETGRFEGHAGAVNALCQLEDGRLAAGSDDGTIRLWDAAGAEAGHLEGHGGAVNALCRLEDGRLASGSADGTIRLWDAATGAAETSRLEGQAGAVYALCRLEDGRLASGSFDTTIRLWNVAAGAKTTRVEGHDGPVRALCLLPDGRLASGSADRTIRLWDVATGAEIARLAGHAGWISALCWLKDGRLASGSFDTTIRLWNVPTGAETVRLKGHANSVTALWLLTDGRLASGSSDTTIRLWNVATGAETARLEGHSDSVTALCLLPDGRLASGSADGTIRLWNVATGAETSLFEGHSDSVTALCLLPDGRLASSFMNNAIRLWNVATGAETSLFEGHSDSVTALCLLPDGRLASGSWDNAIRLWDVATGAEIARLELDAAIETIAAIAPSRIVAGDVLGRLHWLAILD